MTLLTFRSTRTSWRSRSHGWVRIDAMHTLHLQSTVELLRRVASRALADGFVRDPDTGALLPVVVTGTDDLVREYHPGFDTMLAELKRRAEASPVLAKPTVQAAALQASVLQAFGERLSRIEAVLFAPVRKHTRQKPSVKKRVDGRTKAGKALKAGGA
jgi:hypothetical protein